MRAEMTELPVSVIVLTHNEEKNIGDCLGSIQGWTKEIFVVDSGSTDGTIEIAGKYGAKIVHHPFENQAAQLNWALDALPLKGDWILRLDADERVTPALRDELSAKLPALGEDVSALYVKRRVHFMGRWIRHGGYYPIWLLRAWRKGRAVCEQRRMDEHMTIKEGRAVFLDGDILEENRKDLHFWTEKHNGYALREAVSMFDMKFGADVGKGSATLFGTQEQRKRWLKEKVYAKMPLFFRPFAYFLYRYFIRLGFLDGREGLVWHFLQGFWYRFLVDAKMYEIKKRARAEDKDVRTVIAELYKIKDSD